MSDDFKAALTKLASDPAYRQRATNNPETIEQDFELSVTELQALRQAAVMSGADIRAVDALRGNRITARATGKLQQEVEDVSCCSCCCCCCGETAVIAF